MADTGRSTTVLESSAPLSRALKERTAVAHERAENSGFMASMLEGTGGVEALVALLAQSLPIYSALEAACRRQAQAPQFAPLYDVILERETALRADLDAHAKAGFECPTIVPATRAYVAEIEESAGDPARLVGHHYVRYLGDLSGGQIIGTLMRRHHGLDEGLSFYHFDVAKPKVYKDDYRANLDALPLTDAERGAAIDAAVRAFDLNSRLFAELGERVLPSA